MKSSKTSQKKSAPKQLRMARKCAPRAAEGKVPRQRGATRGQATEALREEAATPARAVAEVPGSGGETVRVSPRPNFIACTLTGPDGSARPGWEMWIGGHCFGRADSKKILMASYARLQSPPASFHWREMRRQRRARQETAPRTAGFEEPEVKLVGGAEELEMWETPEPEAEDSDAS